ncbi:MAG: hypothetical protein M3N07_04045 [Pseudomonadota bacterium]|nr:hypothetical protein [Pseudomonadota bacterium]
MLILGLDGMSAGDVVGYLLPIYATVLPGGIAGVVVPTKWLHPVLLLVGITTLAAGLVLATLI